MPETIIKYEKEEIEIEKNLGDKYLIPKYSQKGGNLTYHEINKRSMHW